MEVLRDADRPLNRQEVMDAVAERVEIVAEHAQTTANGRQRWRVQLGFRTSEAGTIRWLTKRDGWSITDARVQALEDFPGVEPYQELIRQYRARRQASQGREYADPRWAVVVEALARLEPGT
jgi:hypothetical protein